MKTLPAIRVFLFFVLMFLTGCRDACKVTTTYVYYQPRYSTSAEVKASVRYEPPRKLSQLGKIYLKDQYLYLVETGEGIHVIDNNDPAHPSPVGFIKIPGNQNLAIIDNFLYADSFIDLVVFSIADKAAIREVSRVERVFNHAYSYGYPMLSNNLVLTSWEKVRNVQLYESSCDMTFQPWGGRYLIDGIAFKSAAGGGTGGGTISSITADVSSGSGVGGSLAQFTITQNNLYALDGGNLDVINLLQPASPVPVKEVEIGWDVETLFPYKDKLFAGSRSGMYIYDLAIPHTPTLLSKYEHMRSCDPVVVDDTYAYVTLRNGSTCQGFVNQLEVINISNLASPQLVKTYPMTNPHGLGIDNTLLFVCDGPDGLKVFDASDVNAIDTHVLAQYPGINALDIIPFNSMAFMISSDGLYQYNYQDPKNIFLVSKLPIVH